MTAEISPSEVIAFWREAGPTRWFKKDEVFDDEIRRRFREVHEAAAEGSLSGWEKNAEGALALLILLDQFPRNMFRGTARAFASDPLALESARLALERGWDRGMLPVEQLFVYLPFEHSESLADQDRACELMKEFGAEQRDYAERHREIIRRFGRFPHRNAILGRESTPEEVEFLKQPGSGF